MQNISLPPPSTISLPFTHEWRVVTPFVYRYLEEKWIDKFFETGLLRLSTFNQFSKYDDEIRGDRYEGSGMSFGETSDNKFIGTAISSGYDAFVFCCSYILDKSLQEKLGYNAALQITNTAAFSYEVSRQLAGFKHGFEGPCIYRSNRLIRRKIDFDVEKYRLGDKISMQAMFDSAALLNGAERMLLKEKTYQDQQEYRMLWFVDKETPDYIDISCPNARQYCRKVTPSEY